MSHDVLTKIISQSFSLKHTFIWTFPYYSVVRHVNIPSSIVILWNVPVWPSISIVSSLNINVPEAFKYTLWLSVSSGRIMSASIIKLPVLKSDKSHLQSSKVSTGHQKSISASKWRRSYVVMTSIRCYFIESTPLWRHAPSMGWLDRLY